MLYTNFPPIHIPKGSVIAQAVPLPQMTSGLQSTSQNTREGGFGSTGNQAMLTMNMISRPELKVIIICQGEQKEWKALLDTGADITICNSLVWPSNWPLKKKQHQVEGVGGSVQTCHSAFPVQILIDNCQLTQVVTVMPLPQNVSMLIGRDVLSQIGATITTNKEGF